MHLRGALLLSLLVACGTAPPTESRTSAGGEDEFGGDAPRHPNLSVAPAYPPRIPADLAGRVGANYPAAACSRGIEGSARARLHVDEAGRVQVVRVLDEAPPGEGFGAACGAALDGGVWEPARDADGAAMPSDVRFTCWFRIAIPD